MVQKRFEKIKSTQPIMDKRLSSFIETYVL